MPICMSHDALPTPREPLISGSSPVRRRSEPPPGSGPIQRFNFVTSPDLTPPLSGVFINRTDVSRPTPATMAEAWSQTLVTRAAVDRR